jgi:DNA-binding winged helix-turn-helix (wHTH) protein
VNDSRPAGTSVTYRCGAIEIDVTRRQVLIDGAPVKLGGRPFALLLALVERRERVVSKQELMDLVWPKLVVEENNLLVHMVALRKLLGPQAITTIPGRGYRFSLPVDSVNGGRVGDSPVTSANLPGNLPPSPPLFGRAEDLHAVEVLLHEHAVVSIVGAAGIGKTRLAPWPLRYRPTANSPMAAGGWSSPRSPRVRRSRQHRWNARNQLPSRQTAARKRSPMALASRNLLLGPRQLRSTCATTVACIDRRCCERVRRTCGSP